jgi:hypothetical protein
MFARHRGTLTILTLLVLVSVGVAGGAWITAVPLDPATAPREQLLRHLALRDLSTQPLAVQGQWVERLERELTSDLATNAAMPSEIADQYRERLASNIRVLQRAWFRLRTAEYADIDPAERGEFLRRQLRVVGAWSRIASLISTQPISSDDAMRGFIAQLDRWLQATSGEERDQMATAVKDGTVCWLSTTDISGQPLAMRRELAERLAHELNRGAEVSPAGLVDAEDRELLLVNAQSLVEAYAYKLAAEYAALPADERPQFIDEQLAAVQRWGVIELLSPAPSDATAASKNQTAAMLALVEQSRAWVDNAPEADRPQVAAFVRGLEQRLLWKQLPSWLRRGE